MSVARIITPRRQDGEHEQDRFSYPFSACSLPGDENAEMGSCTIEVRCIPHLTEVIEVGDFPNNIKRWVWSAPGENDEEAWDGIFELEADEKGPRFAYFHAWCDYTGFDCQGGAYVSVARDIPTLVEFALVRSSYDRYINWTVVADEW